MTRATDKPVRRVVSSDDGDLVAEIRDRTLTLRPVRTRKGGPAEVLTTFGGIYTRCLMSRVDAIPRRKVRRGK